METHLCQSRCDWLCWVCFCVRSTGALSWFVGGQSVTLGEPYLFHGFWSPFMVQKKRILGTKKKRTPSLLITIYCLVTVFSGQTWYTHLWFFFHKAIYLVCVNSSWIFEILPYLNLYVKVKTLGKAWKNIWRLWPLLSWKRVKSSCNSNFQFRIVSKNFKAFSSFDFKSIDSYNQDNKILYSVMKNN